MVRSPLLSGCAAVLFPIGVAVTAFACATAHDIAQKPEALDGLPTSADAQSTEGPAEDAANQCPASELLPGDYERTLLLAGVKRTYRLHVPPSHVPSSASPIVLSLHGGGGDAATFGRVTHLVAKSNEAGFLLLEPDGDFGSNGSGGTWNAGNCCMSATTDRIDDVGFLRAALDATENEVCVDKRRVYATGFSNGAMMTYRLACELPDRIAAIAPVGGGMGDTDLGSTPPLPVYDCARGRPLAVMHLHGSADQCYPIDGGTGAVPGPNGRIVKKSISDGIAQWVKRNECSSEYDVTFEHGSTTCTTQRGCADQAEVTLCVIGGHGHVWPGSAAYASQSICGGVASQDLNATDAIWEFFNKHSIPTAK